MPLLFLVLPLLEIAGFVIVGRMIGVLATLGLVLAAAVVGIVLLRRQSLGALSRAQEELGAGRDPSPHLVSAAVTVIAALFLIVPGFLTDIIGLLLLIPAVRRLAWRLLKGRVALSSRFAGFRGGFGAARQTRRPETADSKVIDLDASDFSRGPNPESPWRLGRRD